MKVKTIIGALVLCGSAQVSHATESSVEETRAATTGLIVGAVAGGPAGAFAGALVGGEVFGRLFKNRRVNRELVSKLDKLEHNLVSERAAHARQLAAVNGDLDKLLALQAASEKSQKLPIQFRTASSDIERHYAEELDRIARVLHRNRDASVVLEGFADRRGDDSYNQALSEKRVATLKQYLLNRGVMSQQIVGIAYGETQPLATAETLESNFFDRRVMLEMKIDLDPQLATR